MFLSRFCISNSVLAQFAGVKIYFRCLLYDFAPFISIRSLMETCADLSTGLTKVIWLPFSLAQHQLLFAVRWVILDVETGDGRRS